MLARHWCPSRKLLQRAGLHMCESCMHTDGRHRAGYAVVEEAALCACGDAACWAPLVQLTSQVMMLVMALLCARTTVCTQVPEDRSHTCQHSSFGTKGTAQALQRQHQQPGSNEGCADKP